MNNQYELLNNNESVLRNVIVDISKTISRPWIKSLEYNFDYYWKELELSITMSNSVSDCELIELRNELLCLFNQRYPNDNLPFEWQIIFQRENTIMEVLLPEDKLRDINDRLCDLLA